MHRKELKFSVQIISKKTEMPVKDHGICAIARIACNLRYKLIALRSVLLHSKMNRCKMLLRRETHFFNGKGLPTKMAGKKHAFSLYAIFRN